MALLACFSSLLGVLGLVGLVQVQAEVYTPRRRFFRHRFFRRRFFRRRDRPREWDQEGLLIRLDSTAE